MNYCVHQEPPPKRLGHHSGRHEEHLPEAAVMLAYAMHLLELGAVHVEMQPDGEHGKRYDVRSWFDAAGFAFEPGGGRTSYSGVYSRGSQRVTVKVRPGVGDVVAVVSGRRVIAECKGGILNTSHSGQCSKLRRGLCEAVGLLLGRVQGNDRQVAVVPHHTETLKVATRMAARAGTAGIEIALVRGDGSVQYIHSGG